MNFDVAYSGPVPKLSAVIDVPGLVTADEIIELRVAQSKIDRLSAVIASTSFDSVRAQFREDNLIATESLENAELDAAPTPADFLQGSARLARQQAKAAQSEIGQQITPLINAILRRFAEEVAQKAYAVISEEQDLWEPFRLDYVPSQLVQCLDFIGNRLLVASQETNRPRTAASPRAVFQAFGIEILNVQAKKPAKISEPQNDPKPSEDQTAEEVLSEVD